MTECKNIFQVRHRKSWKELNLRNTGKTQRDRVEREVGGGIRMGKTWLIHVNV